jgi:molybdopterin-guanine dinucleotide biosynthesis protein A
MTSAEQFMDSLPAFVDGANQVAGFHRLLDEVRRDVQHRYARFLAGDHSVLEPTRLEEIVQALKSVKAEIARSLDASESVRQEPLLCLLVLQALSQLLVRGRSS